VTFSPGSTSRTINVTLNGDRDAETDETLFLTLSSPTWATTDDATATGTILDDDSLIVDDPTVTEGDAGGSTALFTVRLQAARDHEVRVDYATSNGTAQSGVDYLPASGTLTFAPGQTSATVPVTVIGDRLDEANETVLLNLSNATGALLADT